MCLCGELSSPNPQLEAEGQGSSEEARSGIRMCVGEKAKPAPLTTDLRNRSPGSVAPQVLQICVGEYAERLKRGGRL